MHCSFTAARFMSQLNLLEEIISFQGLIIIGVVVVVVVCVCGGGEIQYQGSKKKK